MNKGIVTRVVSVSSIPARVYGKRDRKNIFEEPIERVLALPKPKDPKKEQGIKVTFRKEDSQHVALRVTALRALLKYRHLDKKVHPVQRSNSIFIVKC